VQHRLVAFGIELLSQVGDVHVDDVAVAAVDRAVPDELRDRASSQRLTRVAHEALEELEFALRESEWSVAPFGGSGDGIEHDVAEAKAGVAFGSRGSSEKRAHSSRELVDVERFHEVVVGAGVEAFDPVRDLTSRGEHERRRSHSASPKLSDDVEAVPAREPDVQDHEIRLVFDGAGETCIAVARRPHAVALLAQGAVEHGDEARVVLDDENRLNRSRVRHRSQESRRGWWRSRRARPLRLQVSTICFGCVTAETSADRRRFVAPTVVAGGLAASATTGALIAIGRRLGSIWVPFAAIGATLAHGTISSGATGLVIMGLVIHVVMSFVWAIVFVSLVTRNWRRWSAGVVTGCGELLVSWAVARATGDGLASLLAIGDRLVLAIVSVASLIIALRAAEDKRQRPAHTAD
jgi:hypothetical protein